MIVVVTIIALLATIVVPNVFGNLGSSRQKWPQKAATIRQQISIYLMNNNLSTVPDDFEVSELTTGTSRSLRPKDVVDPWGREFIVDVSGSGANGWQVVPTEPTVNPAVREENADVID